MLAGNKTHGRAKSGRLLYRFAPADRSLPDLLVPFGAEAGFAKVRENKYAVARVADWAGKHPVGTLAHTIGDVSSVAALCEYRLRATGLHSANKALAARVRALLPNAASELAWASRVVPGGVFGAQDRRGPGFRAITVDPAGSGDFDDALGVRRLENGNACVSVYIANVAAWLEALGLWAEAGAAPRVSSVYLPDERRSMLPPALERLCSLRAGEARAALAVDIEVDAATSALRFSPVSKAIVRVAENYAYDDPRLSRDPDYAALREVTERLDARTSQGSGATLCSRDVVAYWMVQTNQHCAALLAERGAGGVFRVCSDRARGAAPSPACCWTHAPGGYATAVPDGSPPYVHATSPIRRLVDVANQVALFADSASPAAAAFVDSWTRKLERVSADTLACKKVQRECALVALCTERPEVLARVHEGVLFGRAPCEDGAVVRYSVYLDRLGLLCSVRVAAALPPMVDGTRASVRIFLFESEHSICRKVRAQLVEA